MVGSGWFKAGCKREAGNITRWEKLLTVRIEMKLGFHIRLIRVIWRKKPPAVHIRDWCGEESERWWQRSVFLGLLRKQTQGFSASSSHFIMCGFYNHFWVWMQTQCIRINYNNQHNGKVSKYLMKYWSFKSCANYDAYIRKLLLCVFIN